MAVSPLEQARALCLAGGVADPPGLLIEAVAGLSGVDKKRQLIAETTTRQLRRMALVVTPRGRFTITVEDLVAECREELRSARSQSQEGTKT